MLWGLAWPRLQPLLSYKGQRARNYNFYAILEFEPQLWLGFTNQINLCQMFKKFLFIIIIINI